MGDMGDMFRDLRAQQKKQRETQEPKAMANARRRLEAAGCEVVEHDSWSYKVKKGKFAVHFWPLKGWYQGSATGRGIAGLLAKLKENSHG